MQVNTIKLPSGKEVGIVDYVEAGVLLDLPKQDDSVEYLLKTLVVSVDGVKENVYENIRKLTIKDYKALDVHLTKLMNTEEEGLKA